MTHCSGPSSEGKAILATRTQPGGAAPSAERERPCSGASASVVATLMKASRGAFASIAEWMRQRCSKSVRFPNGRDFTLRRTWS
jgi:hypothetical protein